MQAPEPEPETGGIALPPRKRQKQRIRPCHPFDRDRPYPDAKEVARLRAIDQDSEEFNEERQKSQGASSCSAAAGLGPATPYHYWCKRTHRIEPDYSKETQALFDRGHRLEPLAADTYAAMVTPTKPDCLYSVGIVLHPTIAWIHASPDRLIRYQPEGAVEIKCPLYCIPKEIPAKYMCQVQHQMACLGKAAEWCDLFYYLHDDETDSVREVKCWRIWRNRDYWAILLKRLRVMADCLQEDRAPTTKDIPLRPTMPSVRTEVILEWDFTE